jgi:hypothetical protein
MALWKLTPAAAPDDDRWQGRTIWNEVIVEAPTAAFARQYAAEWEQGEHMQQVGNESPSPRSGFQDEKLYWARRLRPNGSLHISLPTETTTPVRRALRRQ